MNKQEYGVLKAKFLRLFARVPIPLRDEIIALVDRQPVSWSAAYGEISQEKNKMEADADYFKKLVKERLRAMPPDVSFSVGDFGNYTRNQLIEEVDKGTEAGKAAIEMQLAFIRKMPRLLIAQ